MKTTEPLGVSQKLEIHNKPIVYNFSAETSSEIICSPYNTTYIVVSPHSIISNEHKESIILKKAILKLRFTSGDFIDFSNTFESKAQNLSYANSVSLKNFCEQNKFLSQINNIGISYILSKINNNSLEKNLKSLEIKAHNKEMENDGLLKAMRQLESEKNKNEGQIYNLISEIDDLKRQLEYKKLSEEAYKAENFRLRGEIDDLKQQLEYKKSSEEVCKAENFRLRGEIDELEKKMENESTFKGMLFQRSIDERNRQQEEIQELKKKHAQIIATEVKERDALNKKNRDEIESLKAQLEDCKKAFDAYKNVAILSLKIHQEKIAKLESDLAESQKTLSNFKNHSSSNDITGLDSVLLGLYQSKYDPLSRYNPLESDLASTESRLSSADETLEEVSLCLTGKSSSHSSHQVDETLEEVSLCLTGKSSSHSSHQG